MKTTAHQSRNSLNSDLALLTEGDNEFKVQLATLAANDLQELQQSLFAAIDQNRPLIFNKIYHKVSTTLSVLNDSSLNSVLANIAELIQYPEDVMFKAKVEELKSISEGIRTSLSQIISDTEVQQKSLKAT